MAMQFSFKLNFISLTDIFDSICAYVRNLFLKKSTKIILKKCPMQPLTFLIRHMVIVGRYVKHGVPEERF